MKKQPLLAVLRQSFPQISKDQLYAKILCGQVVAAGQTLRDPKQLVGLGTKFSLHEGRRYVSRGGDKLQKAIEEFEPRGFLVCQARENMIVLDAGASSGGFSDCLLQHGCSLVYAVESGKNQLDFKIRRDSRVRSFEGCKVQNFLRDLPNLGLQMPDFVVMDISFRSILALIPLSLAMCHRRSGVFLCKPQFEWKAFCHAYPQYLNQAFNGVIEDEMSCQVLDWFCEQLEQAGIEILGLCPSPIRGTQLGNLEFLLYLQQPFEMSS